MKKNLFLFISIILAFTISGCTFIQKGSLIANKNNLVQTAYIKDNIQLKLINNYGDMYDLEDVIIGYNDEPFSPLENKAIDETFVSSNQKFNEKYNLYSKQGIQKSFLGTSYMIISDEALLDILANEFAMKLVVFDSKTNKYYDIDFKNSDIKLSDEIRHNIYYGFKKTLEYFEDREKDQ